MIYRTLKSFLRANFQDEMEEALSEKLESLASYPEYGLDFSCNAFSPESFHIQSFYIDKMWIDNLPTEQVKIYLYVKSTLKAEGYFYDTVDHDYSFYTESIDTEFVFECLGSVSKEFKDFEVAEIHPYDYEIELAFPMTDRLVPIIADNQLDEIAEMIVQEYYPEALTQNVPVDEQILATRAGLRLCCGQISEPGALGQIYFENSSNSAFQNFEDWLCSDNPSIPVTAGTAVISSSAYFAANEGRARNIIVHEICHWILHKKAILLRKLLDGDKTILCCEYQMKYDKRHPLYWIERQAKKLAPRILMPYKPFSAKAVAISFINKALHPEWNDYQQFC